ncbi:MAG: membrane protein insertase YidC, partial [Crocinitomicaceae bacterium]|nr:membrane protein insertase YidC [Crocinitomicaceae bacterium]
MDRNTVVGLVLIGLIFSVFTIFNKPSEEEIKAEQEKIEKALAEKKAADEKAKKEANSKTVDLAENWKPKTDEQGNQLTDSTGALIYTDSITKIDTVLQASISNTLETSEINETKPKESVAAVKGELIQMETDKLIIDFDTKGGQIASVRLKEFESYRDYAKNDGKIDPLTLFRAGDASNGLSFPYAGGELNTTNELFTVKSKTDYAITFELKKGAGSIEFIYNLSNGKYDLDFDINVRGFSGQVNPKNVMLNWDVAYRKTERLFSEQRRVSTVCFNYEDDGFSYLSEVASDEEEAEDDIDWVCFKQSYFSSFLKPEGSFKKSGSSFEVDAYGKESDREWSHLKGYSSTLNLNLKNVDNASVRLNWFFGPNDYNVLTSYDSGYDYTLNYGWGIFRWINIYAIEPIFKLLKSSGMAIGIVILILTLLIKSLLMPIQWKMYTSS